MFAGKIRAMECHCCEMGFGRLGRREVGETPSENPTFDRCVGKAGVGDPPSSPASPTKKKRTSSDVRFLFRWQDLKGRRQFENWCKNSPVDCF